MKRTALTREGMDEIVSNAALFFLVMLATLSALNFVSIWVLLSWYLIYAIVGIIVACILSKGQRMPGCEQKQQRSPDPKLDPFSKEVRKPPEPPTGKENQHIIP